MSIDTVDFSQRQNTPRPVVKLEAGGSRQSTGSRPQAGGIPSILLDEIAREEWERVSAISNPVSPAQRTLLVGYCNAIACAIRAELLLAVEGRYYATTNKRGSVLRRRHPAAQDAERGWTAARHLAKQLGITGGRPCDQHDTAARRSMFK